MRHGYSIIHLATRVIYTHHFRRRNIYFDNVMTIPLYELEIVNPPEDKSIYRNIYPVHTWYYIIHAMQVSTICQYCYVRCFQFLHGTSIL
jgi:hypothetical protein